MVTVPSPFSQTPDLQVPLRVVHIDDDPVSHAIVTRCLQRAPGAGCVLRFARDIDAALTLFRQEPADVLLLDLNLPNASGLEALERLLKENLEVPVIVVTSQEDPTVGVAAISVGAEDFLAKDELSPYRLWNTVLHTYIRWQKGRRAPMTAIEPVGARWMATPDSAPVSAALAPGVQVDRYTVESLIGQGGMAKVYLVRHRTLDSMHALKVLRTSRGPETDRLLREARAQARLRHPNLVLCTDVLQLNDGLGVVMEYVKGPTLNTWLQENRGNTHWLELYRGIVRGVRHAHAMGIIHRDLKPANVLIDTVEGVLVPKVTDFGIAKDIEPTEPGATEQGVSMGTPGYMAPEQICDAAQVDARADMFSLGCILYEMALGRPPFRGRHRMQLLNAVLTGSYVRPWAAAPSLPPTLVSIIEHLLEADPTRRMPDCGALLRALDHVAADELPPPSLTETAPGATSRFTIRPRVSPSAAPTCAGAPHGVAVWTDDDDPKPLPNTGRATTG